MANVRIDQHYGTISVLLRNPAGGVARDMLRRGMRVKSQAQRNLQGGGGYPRRVDTGLLRSTIYCVPIMSPSGPGARIGTHVWYARLVHGGTGLYGPRHDFIYPRHGRYLVFTPKGSTVKVFARRVAGMRPNPFLKNALVAAKY